MSTPVRPSTPVAQSTPSTPTTGTWKHPKLDEIVRRQNAARFSADDVKKVLYNLVGIAVVYLLERSVWDRCVPVQPAFHGSPDQIVFRDYSILARLSSPTQIISTTP
jgi:hypothetical protein